MSNIIPFPIPPVTPRMYCSSCGANRTVSNSAADPGPCRCGCTMRQSFKPPEGGSLIDPQRIFFVGPA